MMPSDSLLLEFGGHCRLSKKISAIQDLLNRFDGSNASIIANFYSYAGQLITVQKKIM